MTNIPPSIHQSQQLPHLTWFLLQPPCQNHLTTASSVCWNTSSASAQAPASRRWAVIGGEQPQCWPLIGPGLSLQQAEDHREAADRAGPGHGGEADIDISRHDIYISVSISRWCWPAPRWSGSGARRESGGTPAPSSSGGRWDSSSDLLIWKKNSI